MVPDRLAGIKHGERCNRIVECFALPHIARDGGWVAGGEPFKIQKQIVHLLWVAAIIEWLSGRLGAVRRLALTESLTADRRRGSL
jgi:hypothetical protein